MSQTIAAIATPPAPSAIGILRLSGDGAIEAAAAVFRPAGGKSLAEYESRRLVYGTLLGPDGAPIDQALATISRAPRSYTGEDTAEFQCHGSPAVLQLGLEALLAQGVRQAGPGEFTRRAFLNGKLDLTQAEAVADLIDAETPAAVRQAAGQLSGALGRRVGAIYDGLVDLMAHFHAVLDYPDEDIDPFRADTIRAGLEEARAGLSALLATYERGRYIAGGVPCVLVGRPNAGKSSLLNALVGYDRAIVTDVPGTTRDTVEARCRLGGVVLKLIDTAGLRDTEDKVERIGVERSRAAMEGAALILVLWDGSVPPVEEDGALLERAAKLAPTILVHTKADLPSAPVPFVNLDPLPPTVTVSAKTGQGLDELAEAVAALFPTGGAEAAGELLTNARQAEAARRALAGVERAGESLAAGITPDALLTDVEEALSALGELTGASVREDVTARIFQRFCVGK
ncbi:tRNA uridine-5-carboxymethylaminomethyl(34) synthesis GTPase MnmE [Flavonifractor sp.]|uniref:tRNA uridine-5-carboxymethylaminomethyl(34) synthesis GTPase MnmE n=1 Tax=Flavonifractor sp. TaxID=2049025 RepID=UPI0025BE848E|nr:tRNA uridine-5-carboxymethylaminomethyl(34) synthesis GTPase MnmE [Flavonifractor sp.]